MKLKKNKLYKILSLNLCIILFLSTGLSVVAAPVTESVELISDLKGQRLDLEMQLTDTIEAMNELSPEIEELQVSLTAAKLVEDKQFESMKSRIKFMYEEGSYSLLESLLSSKSMAEFLANTEYVTAITEYDRDMLQEFTKTRKKIESQEAELKSKQEELKELESTINQQITDTDTKIEEELAKQLNMAKESVRAVLSNMPSDELVLFAAILQAEAGSTNYDALLAVATVILNRVANSGLSITNVVYSPGQFSPTWNGSLDRILAKGPASLCVQVATDAINGARTSQLAGWCTQFRTAGHRQGIEIGGNVFF